MTRKLLGCLLLGFGVSVLLLPVLQAVLFFTVGTFVLRGQFEWAHEAVERVRRLVPGVVDGAEAGEAKLLAWAREQFGKLRRLL